MNFRLSFWLGLLPAFVLALAVPWAAPAWADTGHPAAAALGRHTVLAEDANTARVIVQYRRGAAVLAASPHQPQHAGVMGARLALKLSNGRVLGERMQALRGTGLSSSALAAKLAAQPDVEWAVVDGRKGINAVPNDPYFGDGQTTVTPVVGQWFLRAPDSSIVSATNAVGAWDITTGSASITVAVLDTGVRFDHPDLAGKLYAGYDFVRSSIENDGSGGTDADASDPGTWASSCSSSTSIWHGTQVAGLVGAATDNSVGVAGLGRNVMVLPVRVLGACGSGYDNDIIAGMRWAAGLSNDSSCSASSTPSATCNPHPARILNLSLGGSGSCSSAYQATITELVAANVAVVVASGNDAGHAVNSPGNCTGAIAVAGLRHAGTKVGYSNLGPQVAIAAPAGNCVNTASGTPCLYPLMTTINLGTTTPGANGYSDSYNHPSLGTSFATPLVAATVALMRSLDATLTPAQIKTHLQASARSFPTTGGNDSTVAACHAPTGVDQDECYCTTSTCGAGMLDTAAAVSRVQQALLVPTAAVTATPSAPTAGQSVALDGSGSSATSGRTIASYAWAITSGSTLASLTGATNAATATLATSAAGSVTVSLTVTDSAGASSSTSTTLSIAAAPVATTPVTSSTGTSSSGGGGGALGLGWLAGLGAAVFALRPRRTRAG